MGRKHTTAILLAGGRGSRMGTAVAKQFLELNGKPVIWYSLQAIEQSDWIDDCILVVAKDDIPYMREQILARYTFHKVLAIASGGSERYASVANGLRMLRELQGSCEAATGKSDYIFIHDGARPFLSEAILERCYQAVSQYGACVAAVPSKDTVKIADENGFALQTPERKRVWIVQTPQVFEAKLIHTCYEKLMDELDAGSSVFVTDDASVVEKYTEVPVKMVEGDYRNIKLTTPEDLQTAQSFLGTQQ